MWLMVLANIFFFFNTDMTVGLALQAAEALNIGGAY
jgi:hypothetical protein